MRTTALEKPRKKTGANIEAKDWASVSAAGRTESKSAQSDVSSLTAQMNVRMDSALHEAGNAALAEIGVSPSQAVRALWGKAAKRGEDLEEVRTFLFAPAKTQSNGVAHRRKLVEKGRCIADIFYRSQGIHPERLPLDTRTDEELREEMYDDMARDMGL